MHYRYPIYTLLMNHRYRRLIHSLILNLILIPNQKHTVRREVLGENLHLRTMRTTRLSSQKNKKY